VICTQQDARLTLFAVYGGEVSYRLTTRCQIAACPVHVTQTDTPVLAWRKLEAGKDSLVHMGRVLPGGTIDWDWTYTGEQSQLARS
jgi:hypothetical protein